MNITYRWCCIWSDVIRQPFNQLEHLLVSVLRVFLHICNIFEDLNILELCDSSCEYLSATRSMVLYLKNIKCMLQSHITILHHCTHFTLMKKLLESAFIVLCFNKSMDFVECPDTIKSGFIQGWGRNQVLCKISNMFQLVSWQAWTGLRRDMEGNNCVEHVVGLLHQFTTTTPVLFDGLPNICLRYRTEQLYDRGLPAQRSPETEQCLI